MARNELLMQHGMLCEITFCLLDTDYTDLKSLITSSTGQDVQVVLQSTNKQVGVTVTRALIFGQPPVQMLRHGITYLDPIFYIISFNHSMQMSVSTLKKAMTASYLILSDSLYKTVLSLHLELHSF
jgi:hypothetical protein